jgi:hypothetical protein
MSSGDEERETSTEMQLSRRSNILGGPGIGRLACGEHNFD